MQAAVALPRDELLEKYIRLRDQYIDPYMPDFEVSGGEDRYVKFNDAVQGLNPYNRFVTPRLLNKKATFPTLTRTKLTKNADPRNYVRLRYDSNGVLRVAHLAEYNGEEAAYVYVSERLSIGYMRSTVPGAGTARLFEFEWCEYDDDGRLRSVEHFQKNNGMFSSGIIINCEYYEYDGNTISRAWRFEDFETHPMQQTITHEGHVNQAMLDNLAENGIRLV